MFIPRVMTGVIGGALVLLTAYVGGLAFFLIVFGASLIALREFYGLCRETGYAVLPGIGLAGGALLQLSVFLNGMGWSAGADNQGSAALLALLLMGLMIPRLFKGPADIAISEWAVTFFGVIFVTGSFAHLLLLRDVRPDGQALVFWLLGMVWAADTFAYLTGKRLGRHALAPRISEAKTWEGFAGGLAGAALVAVAFKAFYFRTAIGWGETLVIAVFTTIIALASDLGESLIKRAAGAKDSSALLPGHGGFLDRMDSFILAAPFFYYYWVFTKHG